jgi:hypothetical protein
MTARARRVLERVREADRDDDAVDRNRVVGHAAVRLRHHLVDGETEPPYVPSGAAGQCQRGDSQFGERGEPLTGEPARSA